MEISITAIARELRQREVDVKKISFSDWSNQLLNVLEEMYAIETLVKVEMESIDDEMNMRDNPGGTDGTH